VNPYYQTHANHLATPLVKTLREMTYNLTSLARVLHRRSLFHEAMYLALKAVSKCESRREWRLPDRSALSPYQLMSTENTSFTPHPWKAEAARRPIYRPIYRPTTHDAWYMDEAIDLGIEEHFHGESAFLNCGKCE